jgi:hypothetical protein
MTTIKKESHKVDVVTFDIEENGGIFNFTINDTISWNWIEMKLTNNELKGLADFIYETIGEKK